MFQRSVLLQALIWKIQKITECIIQYDEIIRTEDIAGLSDVEYDLAVFFDKKIKGLERKNLFDFVKSNCKCIFAYETDDVYLQNWENKRKLNVNNVTGILAWR